jgi:hypothetical protein
MKLLFVCNRNLASDLAFFMASANPFWNGDTSGLPRYGCDGDPVVAESEGRRDPDPERNWPKCARCGETMIPLCAANPEDEAMSFSMPEDA